MRIAHTGFSAMTICTALTMAACGGTQLAPTTPATAQNTGVVSATPQRDRGCPSTRCIITDGQTGYGSRARSAVLFFARNDNGDAAPVGEISGSKTQLLYPAGLAMDSHRNLYVANSGANAIAVYAAGSEGNVAPIGTIAGAKTKLYRPVGVAIDSQDELYVASDQRNRILTFAPNANGNVAPVRVIEGKKTQLYAPWDMAFDSQANLYVSDDDPNAGWITVYAPGAHGNAAPQRVIKGSATELVGPEGVAVDNSGFLYVVNSTVRTVAIFTPNANGDQAPISDFGSILYAPAGIALDAHRNIYVTDVGYDDPPFIGVFGAGVLRNQGHVLRLIRGRKTKIVEPEGIIVR